MKRVAVTGAAGFIGRHLVTELHQKGYDVLCLGRSSKSLDRIKTNVPKRETDYSVRDLAQALESCDVLVHLAGQRLTHDDDPEFVAPFTDSAMKTLDHLLRAAKTNGLTRVLTASSIGVYSPANETPFHENDCPKPGTTYGLSKRFCEEVVDFWGERNNVPVAHIRLAQCYGHGEKDSGALMRLVGQARRKEMLKLNDGGSFQIDEVYVADAIRAFTKLIRCDEKGPFNIGAGKSYSVLEIAQTANEVFGNNGNLYVEPAPQNTSIGASRYMDIKRAKELLGWWPQYDLNAGMRAMHLEIKHEDN